MALDKNDVRDVFLQAASDYLQTQSDIDFQALLLKNEDSEITFVADRYWKEALETEKTRRGGE